MMNISTKSQPHRVSEEIIFLFFFFAFWLPWQTMKHSSGQKNYMTDKRLLKKHFYKIFAKISSMAWQ